MPHPLAPISATTEPCSIASSNPVYSDFELSGAEQYEKSTLRMRSACSPVVAPGGLARWVDEPMSINLLRNFSDLIQQIDKPLQHGRIHPASFGAIRLVAGDRQSGALKIARTPADEAQLHREVERLSTTTADAYVAPLVSTYLGRLDAQADDVCGVS